MYGIFDAYPRTLKDVLGDYEGPLPAAMFYRLASNILVGLMFLDEHNIVHWDVKSDNVMVSPDGVAYVTDLGEALRFVRQHAVVRTCCDLVPCHIAVVCCCPSG